MTEKNSPKPKPSAPKKVDVPVVYDAVLDEDTISQHTEAEVEVVAEAEAEVVAPVDTEVSEKVEAIVPAAKKSSAPATEYAVVSGGKVDEVRLSAIVFENKSAKKSLSVHHLQRRLREWGFDSAYTDRDGWYSVPTRQAINEFQEAQGLPVGELDMVTLKAIFEGDTNVRVMP